MVQCNIISNCQHCTDCIDEDVTKNVSSFFDIYVFIIIAHDALAMKAQTPTNVFFINVAGKDFTKNDKEGIMH